MMPIVFGLPPGYLSLPAVAFGEGITNWFDFLKRKSRPAENLCHSERSKEELRVLRLAVLAQDDGKNLKAIPIYLSF